jgi:hypothetical protein
MVECGTQQIPQTTSDTELMVGNDPNLQGISNRNDSYTYPERLGMIPICKVYPIKSVEV